MGKNKRRASLTIVLLFIFNLLFTNSIRVYSATDNTLGGRGAADPLKIVVNEDGSLELNYWQINPMVAILLINMLINTMGIIIIVHGHRGQMYFSQVMVLKNTLLRHIIWEQVFNNLDKVFNQGMEIL